MTRWILFVFLSWPCFSYAENFLTVEYSAKTGESLKKILASFLTEKIFDKKDNESLILTRANESMAQTINKNPHIKQWNPLSADVGFKLYIDPVIADFKKIIKYKEKESHHLSLFSMPSFGYFVQSNNSGYNVKYNQNSYLSLGLGYLYSPLKEVHMSASFYYSTISSGSNNVATGGGSSIDIPSEYGGNVYGIYKNQKGGPFSFYAGLDYESFSSFNIQNIIENESVTVDSYGVYYLTVGVNIKPNFVEKLGLKLSLSKSIFTIYSSALESSSKVQLSGFKALAFFIYQLDKNWSVNAMVKSHKFSGDNDLSINRYGIGIGYVFF